MARSTFATFAVAVFSIFAWAPASAGVGGPATCATAGPGSLCLNEVFVSFNGTPQTTADEYIELRGPAGGTIAEGTYLTTIEGDKNAGPGSVDSVIDLGGLAFGANGFLVLRAGGSLYAVHPQAAVYTADGAGFSGNAWSNDPSPRQRFYSDAGVTNYERPSATYILMSAPARPGLDDDIDTVGGQGNPPRGDGIPDGAIYSSWTIYDSVGAADNPNGDFSYGLINFRTGGSSGVGITVPIATRPNYVGRFGDSFGSTANDWVESGLPTGTRPNFFLGTAVPAGVSGKPLNHVGTTNAWFNTAPVVTLPATGTTNEDVALVYAGTLSVADVDSGGNAEQTTITVTNGTFSLSGTAGLTFTSGANGSAAMTFTGTIAALNAALNNARFVPAPEFSGTATVTVNHSDLGNFGTPFEVLSDQETQTITVVVVDDPPQVANQSFSISEDAAIGAAVGTVVATDVDSTPLSYSIVGGSTTFAIDSATGAITTLQALDFETTPSYTLTVAVADATTTSQATVTIAVLNVNDNVPTIAAGQVFSIQENAPNGSAVSPGPVQAADADNDTLSYAFTAPNDAFAINAATGQIVVANTQLIDFETTPSFTINVAVSDGTSSANANVTINVTDVPAGTNAPVVHDQAFSIPQNAPVGHVVGTVFAVDEDGGPLSYAFAAPSTDFAIDPGTGRITVADNANLPGTPAFTLGVVVGDGALTDTANVTINVTGANGAPALTPNQVFSIAENAANGATVGTVTGTDPENNALAFSFNPASTIFAMSAAGVVTVLDGSQLDFETTPQYVLAVQVSDGISTASGTITINVTDVAEGAAPTVLSMNRAGANPATSSPVQWAVTFSENVTGVDSGDFALVAGGTVTGASITSVNCVNAACTITAAIADGAGTLGLNLVDNDSIADTDAVPNPLGGVGAGNGNFTGQVYDIDLGGAGTPTPPIVTSVVRATGSPSAGPVVVFVVTFSEAVTGVDLPDFQLTVTGNLATPSINAVTGAGSTYTVAVATGTGIGTIRLDVVDDDTIRDDESTPLGGVGTGNGGFATGEVYQIDTINTIPLFRDGFEDPPPG